MAGRRGKKKRRRSSGSNMTNTVKRVLRIAALVGPEAGTILASPNAAGVGQAISLKTGFNPIDGSFDVSRLVIGWGPSILYAAGERGAALVKKLTKF